MWFWEKSEKLASVFFITLLRHVFEYVCFFYKPMCIVMSNILKTCIVICAHVWLIWLNSTSWNGLSYTRFLFCLNFVSNESSTKEWAWIYVWPEKKKKQKTRSGWSYLCVRYKLCLFCMLSVKDISECQLFIRGCYFYLPKNTWESGCAGQLTQCFSSF